MAPTKDSYVLIEAGKTVTSPVLDLTSSYKFDSDGIYTIEYTKPFVYISDAEMFMIDDNKNLPQATGYDDLIASTEIELRDTYYLKPTDYEIRMANKEFEEKTSLGDDTVYVSDGCMQMSFGKVNQLPAASRDQIPKDVTNLHKELCEVGYPNAVKDATANSDMTPYTSFFGSANYKDVLNVLNAVTSALQIPSKKIVYVFRGKKCKWSWYAYSKYGINEIHFCQKFENAPPHTDIGSIYSNYNTKFQTMAHEYTHTFADTKDIVYGYHKCRSKLITAADAVENADSYGFYIQYIYDASHATTVATEK